MKNLPTNSIKALEENLNEFFQDNLVFDSNNFSYILGFKKDDKSNRYEFEYEDNSFGPQRFKSAFDLLDYLEGRATFTRSKNFDKAEFL